MCLQKWREDPAALKAWQMGQTGFPLVDAGLPMLWCMPLTHVHFHDLMTELENSQVVLGAKAMHLSSKFHWQLIGSCAQCLSAAAA